MAGAWTRLDVSLLERCRIGDHVPGHGELFPEACVFLGAVVWAVFVEAMLLLTPYASFFGLKMNGRFLFLTASAHLVFGVVLGLYCQRLASRRALI